MHDITDRSATAYKDCVVGHAQRVSNPHVSVKLVVHGALPLTKPRRLAISRELYLFANPGTEALWDSVPEKQKLSWSQTHLGRYGDVLVESARVDGEVQLSFTSKNSSGGGYREADFRVAPLRDVV